VIEFKNGCFFLIQKNGEKRRIGELIPMKNLTIYLSRRNRNQHFFRKFEGWGISLEILNWLIKHDINGICLDVEGENKIYSSVGFFLEYGINYHHINFEPQKILKEKYFSSKGFNGVLF